MRVNSSGFRIIPCTISDESVDTVVRKDVVKVFVLSIRYYVEGDFMQTTFMSMSANFELVDFRFLSRGHM